MDSRLNSIKILTGVKEHESTNGCPNFYYQDNTIKRPYLFVSLIFASNPR